MVAWLQARADHGLALLRDFVGIESHVSQPAGVAALADRVAGELAAAGFSCRPQACRPPSAARDWLLDVMYPDSEPGAIADALLAHRPGRGRRVLILGDLDTAHPPGSLEAAPFRVQDGWAVGPGAADMKGGLVVLCLAAAALAELRLPAPEITVVLSPDEQAGSLWSRALVEAAARDADVCLCLECARQGGRLMAARAQVGVGRVEVHGREAYAGADHASAASALTALASKVGDLDALTDPSEGTYVTVTMLRAGRRRSVVPGRAACTVDVRAPDATRWERAAVRIREIAERDDGPGTRGSARLHAHRPAVPWTEGTDRLLALASECGAEIGIDVGAIASPAAGSSAFAGGVSTLDGMGPCGEGLMTPAERVEVSSLTERAALLALMLTRLAEPDDRPAPTNQETP